jgi:triphosphoribosyl-dephospho-CoA synthase
MNEINNSLGLKAQLACLWEVTARKPGNIHRFRDFADTTYLDFAASAAAIAPVLADAQNGSLGEVVFKCVWMTSSVSKSNTNLGIALLLAPLAKASTRPDYRADVERVLAELTVEDADRVYAAIRLANPGGLGHSDVADVQEKPTLPLRQAMSLAASRDLVARQYANGFQEVFEEGVPAVLTGVERTGCLEGGIIHAHLHLMSRFPDTLIARKRGPEEACESGERAGRVLDLGWPASEEGQCAIRELDDWLREAGHARNPGTTADLIAATLFVLLRTHWGLRGPDSPWALAERAGRDPLDRSN